MNDTATNFRKLETPTISTPVDAEVDIEVLKAVPKSFAVDSEKSANWLVRKIVAARQYADHVKAWADHEQRRSAREEQCLMFLFGRQLEAWAQAEIEKFNGRQKSLTLPAGTVGYRKLAAKLVVDDEAAVLSWARKNCPAAVVMSEKLSKVLFDEHVQKCGEIPDAGAHVEPETERFYIK
jgi:hypothetical protein